MSRLRFAFSLRTLLLAVAVLCIPLGWLAAQARVVYGRKALLARCETHQGYPEIGITKFGNIQESCWHRLTPDVPWARKLFGDQPIDTIWFEQGEPPRDFQVQLIRNFPESHFCFYGSDFDYHDFESPATALSAQ